MELFQAVLEVNIFRRRAFRVKYGRVPVSTSDKSEITTMLNNK